MTFEMGPAILFCPADRPERFGKAAERADAVILDLEDGVAPDAKGAARAAVSASRLDPARTIVRVNPAGSRAFQADLRMLRESGYRTVMLAKTESPADVDRLLGMQVVALLETARGVVRASAIAGVSNVCALMWGAEDLVASLGGSSSRRADGRYRDVARVARANVALAAAAAGVAAIDAVHLNISDLDGLRVEAEDACATGFVGKACIHPTQAAVVREAFAPSAADIAWATRVLAAARDAGSGVFQLDGQMVDEPILRHARALLSRATD